MVSIASKETASKVSKLRHGNLSDRYRNYLLYGDERGKFGMLPKNGVSLFACSAI